MVDSKLEEMNEIRQLTYGEDDDELVLEEDGREVANVMEEPQNPTCKSQNGGLEAFGQKMEGELSSCKEEEDLPLEVGNGCFK